MPCVGSSSTTSTVVGAASAPSSTGVGESQSGRIISTPGDVVVVEEPTQHGLVEFKRAAAIASTHDTLDGVVVDEVLMQDVPEETEEPGVDEEITLAELAKKRFVLGKGARAWQPITSSIEKAIIT